MTALRRWSRGSFQIAVCGLILGSTGCRFGTAPGDGLGNIGADGSAGQTAPATAPEEELELPTTSPPTTAPNASSVGSIPPGSGTGMPPASAGTRGQPGATTPPSTQTAARAGAAAEPAAVGCEPSRKIEGCDPIANVGCLPELGMQCDVDLFATTATGVCVFSAPPPTPDTCLNIPPTESCPAHETCVAETCAKICLCDSDCEPGSCCTSPLGSSPFKACEPC